MNKELLGKSIVVKFNDKTVTVNLEGKNQPITMKEVDQSTNKYSFLVRGEYFTESYSVSFNTTLGVYTSLLFNYHKRINKEDEVTTISAKRFNN